MMMMMMMMDWKVIENTDLNYKMSLTQTILIQGQLLSMKLGDFI